MNDSRLGAVREWESNLEDDERASLEDAEQTSGGGSRQIVGSLGLPARAGGGSRCKRLLEGGKRRHTHGR